MASQSGLLRQIRDLDGAGVRGSLDASPKLLDHRDPRGGSWLHRCAAVDVTNRAAEVAASIEIADDLLQRGLDMDEAAFTESDGTWRATPLWFGIARGRNLALAGYLLERGCDPNHSLWAAGFNDDLTAIDLLVDGGADVEAVFEGDTPFLGAIKTSHFKAAWRLAERGADIDVVDPKGMTALHHMLKKASDPAHFVALARFGPRYDIAGPDGATAAEVLARKRDPALRALATDPVR